GADDAVDVAHRPAEDGVVEEQQGGQGRVLGGGGDAAPDGQVGEEGVEVVGAQLGGVAMSVEGEEAGDPADVGLLRVPGVVSAAEYGDEAIVEARGRATGTKAQGGAWAGVVEGDMAGS